MTRILGLDPGSEQSAICGLIDGKHVRSAKKLPNTETLTALAARASLYDVLVIEDTKAFTLPGGAKGRMFPEQVRVAAFWAGRFAQAWGARWVLIDRREVKKKLCGTVSAGDPQVRDALIDRFGPGREKAIGRKACPGPLYGVKRDCWAALAAAVAWEET